MGDRHRRGLSRRVFLEGSALFMGAALGSPRTLLGGSRSAHEHPREPLLRFAVLADLHYADKDTVGSRHYRESVTKAVEAVERFRKVKASFLVELAFAVAETGINQFKPIINRAIVGPDTWFPNYLVGGEPEPVPKSGN